MIERSIRVFKSHVTFLKKSYCITFGRCSFRSSLSWASGTPHPHSLSSMMSCRVWPKRSFVWLSRNLTVKSSCLSSVDISSSSCASGYCPRSCTKQANMISLRSCSVTSCLNMGLYGSLKRAWTYRQEFLKAPNECSNLLCVAVGYTVSRSPSWWTCMSLENTGCSTICLTRWLNGAGMPPELWTFFGKNGLISGIGQRKVSPASSFCRSTLTSVKDLYFNWPKSAASSSSHVSLYAATGFFCCFWRSRMLSVSLLDRLHPSSIRQAARCKYMNV